MVKKILPQSLLLLFAARLIAGEATRISHGDLYETNFTRSFTHLDISPVSARLSS
jgi:hypothetical protein